MPIHINSKEEDTNIELHRCAIPPIMRVYSAPHYQFLYPFLLQEMLQATAHEPDSCFSFFKYYMTCEGSALKDFSQERANYIFVRH